MLLIINYLLQILLSLNSPKAIRLNQIDKLPNKLALIANG